MCSKSEEELRVKERLLNFFEFKDGKKNVPGILVSEFARSAAGTKTPRTLELRTDLALQKTINYLLQTVVMDKRRSFSHVYDFIFDRLRAVRQEMVIQNYQAIPTTRLLEPIIMFLSFSRYNLCEETSHNFDPKICEQHLQECLKRVLCCYDEINSEEEETTIQAKTRIFMECLYMVFNLGNTEALRRSLTVPEHIKKTALFKKVYRVSFNFSCQNYFKTMVEIRELPHLLCAMASLKMQLIRKNVLEIFSHAYNSKTLVVPLDWLSKIVFQEVEDLKATINHYELELADNKTSVKFSKSKFAMNKLPPKQLKEQFVEEKLQKTYLPELLLLRKF